MVDLDIQEAVRIYLDPDRTGGYEPIYGERRLRERFGADAAHVKARIDEFLAPVHAFGDGIRSEPLTQISERGAARAQELYPTLDPILYRAISNTLAYAWK